MKKIISFVFILFFSSVVIANADLSADLQGYWNMDAISGVASDSSANGNNLTNTNSVIFSTGKINNGADFEDSSSQYFVSGLDPTGLKITGDISFAGWLKIESKPVSFNYMIFAKWRAPATQKLEYQLYYEYGGGISRFNMDYRDAGGFTNAYLDIELALDTWTYVVVTVDVLADEVYYYIDNIQYLGTNSSSTASSIRNTDVEFTIGSSQQGSNYWDGMMDEVAVFDTVLSVASVSELYADGVGNPYPFTISVSSPSASVSATIDLTTTNNILLVFGSFVLFYLGSMYFRRLLL